MLELLASLPTPQPQTLPETASVSPVSDQASVTTTSENTCISPPEATQAEFIESAEPLLKPCVPSASASDSLLVPVAASETHSKAVTNSEDTLPTQVAIPDQAEAIAERRQIVEAKLAEIVARDRAQMATETADQRLAQALELAEQGDYRAARSLLQAPDLSPELRNRTLSRINTLEATNTRAVEPPALVSTAPKANVKPDFVMVQPESAPNTATDPNPGLTQIAMAPYPLPELPPPNLPTPALAVGPQLPVTGSSEFRFPLPGPAVITSGYGMRRHPILGGRRMHRGTDLSAPHGTPVLAAFAGRVTTARSHNGYGLTVVIEHESGSQNSLYAHMSEITVRPGQWVQPGEMIGRVGSTGLSTGPHLHFELRQRTAKGWETFDPGPHLRWAMAQLNRRVPS